MLFCNMLIAFYTVQIVYICVFMTCPTSYCLSDTLMDPWNVCVCVCVCVYGVLTAPNFDGLGI